MLTNNHQNFLVMDELSLSKVPFFFMIDFLVEKVEIFTEDQFAESGLSIDFQSIKTEKLGQTTPNFLV